MPPLTEEPPTLRVGIVGFGTVGRALGEFFGLSTSCSVVAYDKHTPSYSSLDNLREVNACDVAFVAVPTPYDATFGQCDISEVREAVNNLSIPMCVKSTVPPGTIEELMRSTGKAIAYSPEYLGESSGHPWREVDSCGFVILAGDSKACSLVRRVYECAASGPLRFVSADVRTAELAKYMGNCFLATKVAFVNQFFDLAHAANVDFTLLRELFLLDPRVGESHTNVTVERGFDGKCLPKDLHSIVAWARDRGGAALLEAVVDYNERLRLATPKAGAT